MRLRIDVGREDDGRWLAEVVEWPRVMAFGDTREEAVRRVMARARETLEKRPAEFADEPAVFLVVSYEVALGGEPTRPTSSSGFDADV